jgi:hypothetical protein
LFTRMGIEQRALQDARCSLDLVLFQRPFHMLAHHFRRMIQPGLEGFDDRDGRRCIAQSYCQISQPALIAGAPQGRSFGIAQKRRFVPQKQRRQLSVVEAVARFEIRLISRPGKAIPGADNLAVITAKHPIADVFSSIVR